MSNLSKRGEIERQKNHDHLHDTILQTEWNNILLSMDYGQRCKTIIDK